MRPIDLVILAVIFAYCAYVIRKEHLRRKNSSCGGGCIGCSSANLCHLDFKKIQKEIKEKEKEGEIEV